MFYSSFSHSLIAHDIVYSVSVVTSHFLTGCWFYELEWDRRDGWGHLQGAVHMAAARLGFIGAMVGSCWFYKPERCISRKELRTLAIKETNPRWPECEAKKE